MSPVKTEVLRVAFNEDGMWKSAMPSAYNTGSRDEQLGQYASLDSLLNHADRLTPKHRKLIGFLLAASFFKLSDSPWINQHLTPDRIFVPTELDGKRLRQWYPHIACTLATESAPNLQSEHMAALGVLILELEANRKAEWAEEDSDWISGEKSSYVRLARILKSWEDLVSDSYRGIAKACLEFDSLVANLDHQDIVPGRKGLAVTLQCILEPLWPHMVTSFGILDSVFAGLFQSSRLSLGLSQSISPVTTAKRILFDDDDEAPAATEDRWALNPLLLNLAAKSVLH